MKTCFLIIFYFFSFAFAIGQWQPTNGPYGGGVNCFAHLGTNIYVGTDQGVFVSSNGTPWTLSNNGISGRITALAVSGTDIYAGTNGFGIFKSTNNGLTWIASNYGLTSLNINAIYKDGSFLFIGTNNGIYKKNSTDSIWINLNNGLPIIPISSLINIDSIIVVGTQSSGIYISQNDGLNWNVSNSGLPYDTSNSCYYNITSITKCNNILFAGVMTKGIYKSSNNGLNWVPANNGITSWFTFYSIISSGNSIYAGSWGGGVLKSTNSGSSWVAINSGLQYKGIQSLYLTDSIFFAGTNGGGVFISFNNGINWLEANEGLNGTNIISLMQNGPDIYAGTWDAGAFKTTNNGLSWSAVLKNKAVFTFLNIGNSIYLGTNNDGIYLSTNNGTSWVPKNNGISNLSIRSLYYSGGYLYTGTFGGGIFVSSNNASSWAPINSGLTNLFINTIIKCGNYLYAGTWGNGVFRSSDNGQSWATANTGLTDGVVLSFALNGTNLLAGTANGGVFLSTDFGSSWAPVNTGLTDLHIHSIISNASRIFAATGKGVFFTTNNGQSWFNVSDGLFKKDVRSLCINNNFIYAGIWNSGVWKRPMSDFNFFSFSGNVFNDLNDNGIKDTSENGIPNVLIKTKSNNWIHNTDSSGNFTAFSNLMNDTISVVNQPYGICTPSFYSVTYHDSTNNFAVHYMPNIQDLKITVTHFSFARPGWDNIVKITYKNCGTTTLSGSITLNFDQKIHFISSNPAQSNIFGNIISWNYTNLSPFEQREIEIKFHIPTSVVGHDFIYFTGRIFPITGDIYVDNNIDSIKKEVTTPIDPNYKEVYPEFGLTPEQIINNDALYYTIHFQNTGNDTAFFVKITDTLSPLLDHSTFEILSSSHPCSFNIHEAGIVDFYFNNILLPDSNVDPIGSNGFVKYTVKPKQNFQLSDSINNTAYIFFDFNTAIVTNTTNSTINNYTSVYKSESNEFLIYPNPTHHILYIQRNGTHDEAHLYLYNVQGLLLHEFESNKNITSIDFSVFQNGIYFIKIKVSENVFFNKIIKY